MAKQIICGQTVYYVNLGKAFKCQLTDDIFWFTIFGCGLKFYKKAMFSDRHFKSKTFFGYYIKWLNR